MVAIFSVRFSREYLSVVTRRKLVKDLSDVLFPELMYKSLFLHGPDRGVLKTSIKVSIPLCMKTCFFIAYVDPAGKGVAPAERYFCGMDHQI